jgi:ABC-2 type transport system permease protein
MPGLGTGIATAVREGELRKFLLQPIDYVTYMLSLRAAHKAVYYVMAFVPYFIVFWMCREFLPGWPQPPVLGLYLLSLVLAFLLGFTTSCLIGLLAFWFLEVSTFIYLFMIASYFLSGHMFPLSLLPDGLGQVVTLLPFAYETYYPTMIILQKLSPDEMMRVVVMQLFWITVMFGLSRLAWSRGLRRYAAFGG